MSLIGGESLSDKGVMQPFWGMWAANILFLSLSAWGVVRFGHETSTSRGGGWEDLLGTLRGVFRRRHRQSPVLVMPRSAPGHGDA
jgi:hypothetical protein